MCGESVHSGLQLIAVVSSEQNQMDINAVLILLTSLLSVSFGHKGKPIDGIIIGSSEDTSGFPSSYDFPTYPPAQKNNKNQASKNSQQVSTESIKDGSKISHLTITKHVPYPVPHPVPYPVYEKIPFPVKVPVPVKVEQPYNVKVYKPYPVRVDKPVPYQVIKNVAVPVKVPVNVPVPVKVPVLVPQPYPVKITKNVPVQVPETIYVKKPVLVYIGGYNKNGGYVKGEADVTHEDGFDRNTKTDYAVEIDWDGKSGAGSQPIEVEVDVEDTRYPPKMYTKVDFNNQKRKEGEQRNGRLVVFRTGLSKSELSEKLLQEKRDYASSEEQYIPQTVGVNAQLKTLSTYLMKPEEPAKTTDQNQRVAINPTTNVGPQLFTSQEENDDKRNNIGVQTKSAPVDQNGQYVKLIPENQNSKNEPYFLRGDSGLFRGDKFAGLSAYATHSGRRF